MIALREQGRMADAIKLAHAVLAALWAEEKNTGDPATLRAIIKGCGIDADFTDQGERGADMAAKREAYTKYAIDHGVFGAPSFVIDGEIFWGQDRWTSSTASSRRKRATSPFETALRASSG